MEIHRQNPIYQGPFMGQCVIYIYIDTLPRTHMLCLNEFLRNFVEL